MTVIQEDCIRVCGRTRLKYSEILTRVSACRRTARVPRITKLSAIVFLLRVQLSKYRGALLYGSVPINHLTHGPTIRLLERERAIILPDSGDARPPGSSRLDLESSPNDYELHENFTMFCEIARTKLRCDCTIIENFAYYVLRIYLDASE